MGIVATHTAKEMMVEGKRTKNYIKIRLPSHLITNQIKIKPSFVGKQAKSRLE